MAPDTQAQRHHAREEARIAHPKQFGAYRIVPNALLGQGGMGVVYTAEQAHPKRLVALKVIRPMLGTRDMIRRFRMEAEVLGRLEHPGIARIYDAGSADAGAGPQPFFAMELVKGSPLVEYVAAGNLATGDKLELMARICDAVHYAHDHGVIHRDLKPSNILIELSGQPKILDFGVARVTDADVQTATMQTESGSLVGTVQYMSPEQAGGVHREVDARSDVYALGLIAYEIFAGKYPFDFGNSAIFDVLRIVREQDVPALSSHDKTLRGDIETIVHKAVEKEKSRRYASAAELASDIRKHLAHRPISARPPSFGYVASRYLRRNRVLVGSAAAAVLMVALGLAWMAAGGRATSAQRVNELTRQFDQQLARSDWSPRALEDLERIESELSTLSQANAEAASSRLQRNLAQHVRDGIYRPRLENVAQIEQRLALLAARDPEGAAKLERELAARASELQPALVLSSSELIGASAASGDRFCRGADGTSWTFAAPQGYKAGSAVVPLGVPCGSNTRAELTVGETWETLPAQIGFAFLPTAAANDAGATTAPAARSEKEMVEDRAVDGYTLQLDVEYLDDSGQVPTAALRTLAGARMSEGDVVLTIRRGTRVLREMKWDVDNIPSGPLTVVATRNGGELSIVVNGLPPVKAMDAFPAMLANAGVAVKLADGAAVERLAVLRRPLPQMPHPIEAADERFAAGAFNDAAIRYESVATGDPDPDLRLEARFKLGVSLARQSRSDEAVRVLDALVQEPPGRWSAAAGCSLWLIHLENDRRAQAQSVVDLLSARFPMQMLVEVLPDDMRRTLQGIYINEFNSLNLLRRPDPASVERLRQAAALDQLMDPEVSRLFLVRAYEAQEDFAAATAVAEKMVDDITLYSWRGPLAIQTYSTLMRLRNDPQKALDAVHEVLMDNVGNARPQFWQLMVERARLLEFMGDHEQAERDLVTFLKHRQDRTSYAHLADASLLLGCLRERRGDHAGALEAWRGGLHRDHLKRSKSFSEANRRAAAALATNDSQSALALGCLANDITDAEIDELGVLGQFSNNEGFDFIRRAGYRVPASAARATFADPRGRAWAYTFAMRADPPPQLLRTFVTHMLREFFCESTVGSSPTPEQDAIMSRAAEDVGRMYIDRKIGPPQILQFGLAWKGTTGPLGWQGLYDALDPSARGSLGHVMAIRYERMGLADAAAAVREQAEADMATFPPSLATNAPATTAPAAVARTNVKVDAPNVRPPGSPRVTKAAPARESEPVQTAKASPSPTVPPAPAPAVSSEARLYDELKAANAQAYRLRRDGKIAEAADVRRGVVERAKGAWPAGDERVISFTLDYVELLLELRRLDEADGLVRTAQADAGASGPATERAKMVAARLGHALAGAATGPPVAATAPATKPTVAAAAPAAPAAPGAALGAELEAELKFVTDSINTRQYRDAELRLLEMYGNTMAGVAPDAQPRRRAVMLALARVYDAWGKAADARLFRDRAEQTPAGELNARKLEWLDAMNRQAFALRQQNRLDLADALRQRVVTEAKTVLPAGDPRLIAFQIDYVDLLLQMMKYAEAERELLEAEKTAGDSQAKPDAARIRRSLIRLYDLWGKPEKARALQSRPAPQPTTG
ncbi:MAG TPA: protein kinase [Tepidisphaeraceae bacterium]|nr:protein kinase [Tepidisphaeraceae bacterium]